MKLTQLSASKIKAYKQCEFKFYLDYHLGLDLGTSFAAQQGSMVHIIFEKFAEAKKDGIKTPKITKTWYDEILYAHREENLWRLSDKALQREKTCDTCEFNKDKTCFINNLSIDSFHGCPKDEFEDAIWLVEKVINDKSVTNPLNKKVIDVENRFEIIINHGEEKIPIVGLVDIVTELDKDTIEITDYKTGNYTQSYNQCIKDPQLLIYHLAARHSYKDYENIFITAYYLRKKPVTLAFSRRDEKRTVNALKKYWYSIKHNQSPKRRCDKPDGRVEFDYVCKSMCNPEICKKQFKKFQKNNNVILPAPSKKQKKRYQWLKHLKKLDN